MDEPQLSAPWVKRARRMTGLERLAGRFGDDAELALR